MSQASTPTLLDTRATAEMLGVQPRTLEAWRMRGHGPPFITLSPRCVRYQLDAVEQWLEERTATSTYERFDEQADDEEHV